MGFSTTQQLSVLANPIFQDLSDRDVPLTAKSLSTQLGDRLKTLPLSVIQTLDDDLGSAHNRKILEFRGFAISPVLEEGSMKRVIVCSLFLLLGMAAHADEFRGYVTALPCGPQAEITTMEQEEIKEAVAACVNNADGKLAVFVLSQGAAFVAEPEESAGSNIGYEVVVRGTLDGTTLRIDEIGSVEDMQESKRRGQR